MKRLNTGLTAIISSDGHFEPRHWFIFLKEYTFYQLVTAYSCLTWCAVTILATDHMYMHMFLVVKDPKIK